MIGNNKVAQVIAELCKQPLYARYKIDDAEWSLVRTLVDWLKVCPTVPFSDFQTANSLAFLSGLL